MVTEARQLPQSKKKERPGDESHLGEKRGPLLTAGGDKAGQEGGRRRPGRGASADSYGGKRQRPETETETRTEARELKGKGSLVDTREFPELALFAKEV